MRTRTKTAGVTYGRLATMGCMLALLLGTLGCSTPDEPEKHEDFEEFSFPEPEGQDYECDGESCGQPHTIDMCGMTNSDDVLAFVRVLEITEHRDTCEDRPYRHDYRDVEIEVLDIAAGDTSFTDASFYRDFLGSGSVNVGQPYIMSFKQLDGVWWNGGITELTPTTDPTEVSPVDREPVSEHGGGTIYDLPTNRSDFVAEATRVWNNYEEECDPEGRRGTDLDHMNSFIYGKSCRDPGAITDVNNGNGPIPGDDTYDAGD